MSHKGRQGVCLLPPFSFGGDRGFLEPQAEKIDVKTASRSEAFRGQPPARAALRPRWGRAPYEGHPPYYGGWPLDPQFPEAFLFSGQGSVFPVLPREPARHSSWYSTRRQYSSDMRLHPHTRMATEPRPSGWELDSREKRGKQKRPRPRPKRDMCLHCTQKNMDDT